MTGSMAATGRHGLEEGVLHLDLKAARRRLSSKQLGGESQCRHSQWHTSSNKVTPPNPLWMALRLAPQKGTHTWYSKPGQNPVAHIVTGHRRKATNIVLLNQCDNPIKLPFKCLSLHLLNTVSVNLNLSWKEISMFAVEDRCTEKTHFHFHFTKRLKRSVCCCDDQK